MMVVETKSHQLSQNCPHLTLLSRTIQLILYHLKYRKSLVQFEESCNLKKKLLWEWRWDVRETETSEWLKLYCTPTPLPIKPP